MRLPMPLLRGFDMTDPKAQADAIDPQKVEELVERLVALASPPYDSACFGGPMKRAATMLRTLLSRIEGLESAAALAGKMAIEEAARVADESVERHKRDKLALDGLRATMGQTQDRHFCMETASAGIATAIRSLSKPIDRNALIERGAVVLFAMKHDVPSAAMALRSEDIAEPYRSQYLAAARAVLSAWIGEETK